MIISAGNDIIDLKEINAGRTKEERFYKKFITGPETLLYSQPQLAGIPFECFVWMLWSIKESVYKFMQRHNPGLIFSPSKIQVEEISNPVGFINSPDISPAFEAQGFNHINTYNGIISAGADSFYSRSVIGTDYIFSVINNTMAFNHIYWGIKLIAPGDASHQSATVREFLLAKVGAVLGADHLHLHKNAGGCPVLFAGESEINVPVSLTHHGRYVAYAFPGQLI